MCPKNQADIVTNEFSTHMLSQVGAIWGNRRRGIVFQQPLKELTKIRICALQPRKTSHSIWWQYTVSSDRQNANNAYRIHTERYVQMTCSNTSMVTKPFHAMMTSTREDSPIRLFVQVQSCCIPGACWASASSFTTGCFLRLGPPDQESSRDVQESRSHMSHIT